MNNTLINGTPVSIIYKDGTKETVLVKELDLESLYTWAEHVKTNKTVAIIQLCTGRPLAWVKSVSLPSIGELSDACFKANFPLACQLLKDPIMAGLLRGTLMDAAAALQVMPAEMLEELDATARAQHGQTGSDLSATSSPIDSTPGTTSYAPHPVGS